MRRSADTRTRTRISITKTGEERRVDIGARTVAVLKAHKKHQREERMATPSWQDPGLVLPNTEGKVRRRDSVIRSLRRSLAEAGLPAEVRFHDIRHTAATLAIKQGIPIPTVSKMLGPSDPAMTLRRCAHVLDEIREDAARVWTSCSDPLTPLRTQPPPTSSDSARQCTILEAGD